MASNAMMSVNRHHRHMTGLLLILAVAGFMAMVLDMQESDTNKNLYMPVMVVDAASNIIVQFAEAADDPPNESTTTVTDPYETSRVVHTVKAGLEVASIMLENGDVGGAAYATGFSAKHLALGLETLRAVDRNMADSLHIDLFDMSTSITDTPVEQSQSDIEEMLRSLDRLGATRDTSDPNLQDMARTAVVLTLGVADEQYLEAGEDTTHNEAAYMISRILFSHASDTFMNIADESVMLDVEQISFFNDLTISVENRESFVTVGTLTGAIQRDLLGIEATAARDYMAYFENIRNLYAQMRTSLQAGDYASAQELAIEAYLENFEYLEPPLEEIDAEFMYALEVEMREDLRSMIRDEKPAADILEFLDTVILPKLSVGEQMISDHHAPLPAPGSIASGAPTKGMGQTTESEQSSVRNEIDFIRDSLNEMVILYESGDHDAAYVAARTAYLDSYEYVEIPLRPIAPDFTLEVEYLFADLRKAIKDGKPVDEIRSLAAQIDRNLDESERLVTGTGEIAPMIAFTASFAIIFREGLEAVLILGAIMTYLEASRNSRFKPYVHYGVIAAIGATAVTWFVASYIIEISGASRELIEAIAALSATAVLFYVSFWILNKIEHKKWMEFVKAKVWQATTTGSVMVFVMLSFFTVYREGFETVLFYQAMFGFAKYMEMYVGLGFVLGLASLFAVYFVMRMMGKRLPLRALFGLTMGIGAYLSIAFLGNAIRELQILDVVPYTSMMGVIPRLDINMATMTGIYPTLETVIGQFVLLSIYAVASFYILVVRPRKEREMAAMRKSRKRTGDDGDHESLGL